MRIVLLEFKGWPMRIKQLHTYILDLLKHQLLHFSELMGLQHGCYEILEELAFGDQNHCAELAPGIWNHPSTFHTPSRSMPWSLPTHEL
eukprot:scaffold135519_cov81-Cyclotella_meneghiniana.AAC.4